MKRSIALVLMVLPGIAWAQNQKQTQPRPASSNSPLYWSVDFIINNYVKQVGVYYKLSPEQEEYTRNLTAKRVKEFLVDYEKDIRWMAAEMMDYRAQGQMPPPEIAKVWGERAKQMLPAIQAKIMEGNAEWREILNEDQKRQHDHDLQALDKQFDGWNKMFDRWSKGEVSPTDLDAPGAISQRPRTIRPSEDAWEFYVRTFIQMYSLDEGQQQSANSILRESREQASHYREAHKGEFSQLDAADQAVAHSDAKTDPDELKRVQAAARDRAEKRRELEKPISEMFDRLKSRLNELPTVEQRRTHDQRLAKLQTLGKRSATRPAIVGITTQPVTSAAATK